MKKIIIIYDEYNLHKNLFYNGDIYKLTFISNYINKNHYNCCVKDPKSEQWFLLMT